MDRPQVVCSDLDRLPARMQLLENVTASLIRSGRLGRPPLASGPLPRRAAHYCRSSRVD